jgi:hypothetical protein
MSCLGMNITDIFILTHQPVDHSFRPSERDRNLQNFFAFVSFVSVFPADLW